MENIKYWPIGSCVIIKGSVRKIIIIARGLVTAATGEPKYFDYGGCFYPEGLVGDQILFFNHEDISEVIHEGYKDDDEPRMVENVNQWIKDTGLPKGSAYELNKKKGLVSEFDQKG